MASCATTLCCHASTNVHTSVPAGALQHFGCQKHTWTFDVLLCTACNRLRALPGNNCCAAAGAAALTGCLLHRCLLARWPALGTYGAFNMLSSPLRHHVRADVERTSERSENRLLAPTSFSLLSNLLTAGFRYQSDCICLSRSQVTSTVPGGCCCTAAALQVSVQPTCLWKTFATSTFTVCFGDAEGSGSLVDCIVEQCLTELLTLQILWQCSNANSCQLAKPAQCVLLPCRCRCN